VFATAVTDFWLRGVSPAARADRVHAVVDPTLTDERSVSLMTVADGPRVLALSPDRSAELGIAHGDEREPSHVVAALDAAGVVLNDPDHIFHFSAADAHALVEQPLHPGVRALSLADQAAFDVFTATAPEADADEAFVELDHWLVFGCFDDDVLVGAASMYPWDGSTLADTGVLTLPDYRGRGFAAATVRALSAEALRRGCEPQYRCQVDNVGSIAVAGAAGLARFGTWEVILPAD
jgi:GNAT superfamily N-acetyltransferase